MKNSKMQFAVLLLSILSLLTAAYGQITGVTAGTDLTGGGTSGNVTLNLNTSKVPQLATANTFTGNQTIVGDLTDTGTISASTNASTTTIQGANSGAGTGVAGSSLTGVAGIFQVESNAGIILQGKYGSSTVFMWMPRATSRPPASRLEAIPSPSVRMRMRTRSSASRGTQR